MSRPLRVHVPDMLYHVAARGNNKQFIYADDEDCRSFLQLLARTLARFRVSCAAYCLMPNHYHLLLKPERVPISRLMQQLNSEYCQLFNRRHGRVGHVLQGRFGARLVEDGEYARAVIRYVALNPVLAHLVDDPAEWRWGSYRYAMGAEEPTPLLSLTEVWAAFGTSDPAVGRSRLEVFVRARLEEAFANPLLHGSEQLARCVGPLVEPHRDTLDHQSAERHGCRPSIGALFDGCVHQAELDEAARVAFNEHAYTLIEIGRVVTRHPSVVSRWVQRASRRRRRVSAVEDSCARNKI